MKAAIQKRSSFHEVMKHRQLYSLMLPGLALLIVFMYIPMVGIVIAFKDYTFVGGIFGSEWVGLKHFQKTFTDPYFYQVLGNTLIISAYKLLFNFVTPVVFAVLLNEITNQKFKKAGTDHLLSAVLYLMDCTVGDRFLRAVHGRNCEYHL